MSDTVSAALPAGRVAPPPPDPAGNGLAALLWALPPSLALWAGLLWGLWRLVG